MSTMGRLLRACLCLLVAIPALVSGWQAAPLPWRVGVSFPSSYTVKQTWPRSRLVTQLLPAENDGSDSLPSIANGDAATAKVDTVEKDPSTRFRCASYVLVQAGLLGILSGWSVGLFKLAIDAVAHFFNRPTAYFRYYSFAIPAIGGLLVAALRTFGPFPPGLRGTIEAVDADSQKPHINFIAGLQDQLKSIRKSLAAVVTLGTGCSLGPEGPAVEIGMNLSRLLMDIFPRPQGGQSMVQHNRLLLACGAAAGVSAGFNAPIAGVFFALEIMQSAFNSIDSGEGDDVPSITTASSNMGAVLLSSVLSALVAKTLVGEHLVLSLKDYSLPTPLMELPIYLALGATSGFVAYMFSNMAKLAQSFFQGKSGPKFLQKRLKTMPTFAKLMAGGLFCGLVGLAFPQILYSGSSTINGILGHTIYPTQFLVGLLMVKILTTAVSAGSGLVGGTFAPSLFLGTLVGAAFHNVISMLLKQPPHGIVTLARPALLLADVPAYAMMGAASVLAAVFRAPLTGALLLFEMTRDYNAMLPLMASCGVASMVGDILEQKQERRQRRDQDSVSWGDLSSKSPEALATAEQTKAK